MDHQGKPVRIWKATFVTWLRDLGEPTFNTFGMQIEIKKASPGYKLRDHAITSFK